MWSISAGVSNRNAPLPPRPWNLLVWHDVSQLSVAATTQRLTGSSLRTTITGWEVQILTVHIRKWMLFQLKKTQQTDRGFNICGQPETQHEHDHHWSRSDGIWTLGVLTDLLWCRRCWNNRLKSLQWTLHGTSGIVPSHPSPSARGAGRVSSAARLQQTHGTNILYTQNILYLMLEGIFRSFSSVKNTLVKVLCLMIHEYTVEISEAKHKRMVPYRVNL